MFWKIHLPRPKIFPKGGGFAPLGPRDCPKVISRANLMTFCLPANVYIVPICIIAGALSMFSVQGCVPDILPREHPLLQEKYTGLETARLWKPFFCRFSLRLSENNRSRVKFIAKFGPTASNFGYIIFPIFG